MPGRKPLYQSEAERPVSLCVRVPRELHEQVQRQVDMRCITMTEAVLDALRLWVETPADPRDTPVSPSGHTTVLQEFEERVDARLEALEAALATLRLEAAVSTDTMPYDNSITSVIQESDAALPADGTPQHTGYGALAGQVQAYLIQHQRRCTCAEIAKAVGATSKSVNQPLKRFVTQGLVGTEGRQRQAVYWWLGA